MQKLLEKLDFAHSKLTIGFVYYVEHLDKNGKRKSIERIDNLIPAVGVEYILNTGVVSVPMYASLWTDASFTPEAASVLTDMDEPTPLAVEDVTYYTDVSGFRPLVDAVITDGLWSNAAIPIDFVFGGGAVDIYGGFITNTKTRGSYGGTLLSAVKFGSAKVMGADETLRVTCGLQLTAI